MTSKREIKPYAFIDRQGNKITRAYHMARQAGTAYGFFNCRASKQEIEAELPTLRSLAQTPNQLGIS